MGFKASMIMIQQPSAAITDAELLEKLGFDNFSFSGDITFEVCMYPNDKSINIGHYNDCLIIADDYQLTDALDLSETPNLLSDFEKILTNLSPGSEILSVACHSGVNYHLYSLVKDGQKLRFKKVVHGEPTIDYGDKIKEEESVYANSKLIGGQRMFKSMYNSDEVYDNTEDQMMEEFAFGVAKRHLGVMILSPIESEELLFNTSFKKYVVRKVTIKKEEIQEAPITKEHKKESWLSKLFRKS